MAYLWPDQPERLARTSAAMKIASVTPAASDAALWIASRLRSCRKGSLHVVYTTVAAQYFSAETAVAFGASLNTAGIAASADASLMHFAMKADEVKPGAGLTATLWRGGEPEQFKLGRAHFHVDWIHWAPDLTANRLFPLDPRSASLLGLKDFRESQD